MWKEAERVRAERRVERAIDDACSELSALASRIGAGGVELLVRADGRVTLRLLAPAGWARSVAQADVVRCGAAPTPSAALASLVRT